VFCYHRLHQPVNLPLSSNVQKLESQVLGWMTVVKLSRIVNTHRRNIYLLRHFFLLTVKAPTANLNTFAGNQMSHLSELCGGMAQWFTFRSRLRSECVRLINVWTCADMLIIRHSAHNECVQLLLTVNGRRCSDTTDGPSMRIVWGSWLRFQLGNY